jgi:DNA polymerase III gamma/tau subunit
MQLTEKYRPRDWRGIVGQDKAIARLEHLARSGGFAGRAVWISGRSGSGKTTAALVAAATVADEWHTHTSTGRSLTLSLLREWIDWSRFAAPRAFIVNEAHGLSAPVIEELLDCLEPIPPHVAWFFTTTKAGQESLFGDQIDAHPLLSRCALVAFSDQPGAQRVAEYLRGIAQAEGLDGRPVAQYVRLFNRNKGNIRACLQEIEAGGMMPGADAEGE